MKKFLTGLLIVLVAGFLMSSVAHAKSSSSGRSSSSSSSRTSAPRASAPRTSTPAPKVSAPAPKAPSSATAPKTTTTTPQTTTTAPKTTTTAPKTTGTSTSSWSSSRPAPSPTYTVPRTSTYYSRPQVVIYGSYGMGFDPIFYHNAYWGHPWYWRMYYSPAYNVDAGVYYVATWVKFVSWFTGIAVLICLVWLFWPRHNWRNYN